MSAPAISTTASLHRTARTPAEFLHHLNQTQNFLIARECLHFEMEFPPVEDVIDILRRDEDTRARSPQDVDKEQDKELAQWVKTAPIEEVMEKGVFGLSNFELNHFYGPGQFLHQLQDQVMIPWRTFLASNGYTWQRCSPYIFITTKGVSSTFHADYSHVVAWQLAGTKTFNGFLDPEKYAPIAHIVKKGNTPRSAEIPPYDEADLLCYEMRPGDLLWNQLLTPHWVTAGEDQAAFSLNISHGGVRHRGQFCANEIALRQHWEMHPEEAWVADLRY
jgi:hypothetical protein